MRRILKPDGLFLAAFFGGETLKELRAAFAQAESEIDGVSVHASHLSWICAIWVGFYSARGSRCLLRMLTG